MKIRHPSILNFCGFNLRNFQDQPYPIIITEYMEQGSLSKVLEASSKGLAPHEWTFTKKFINILGIAIGMQHLHSQGIIHRDLKPDNILLDSNFYPRICDFGLSKIFEKNEENESMSLEFTKTSVAGTVLYMAPEIVDGEKYSKKIDVYAYSLIVYEILSGNSPKIPGNNAFQIMYNTKEGKRPNLSNLPNETQRFLIEQCWCGDPKARYSFTDIISFLISSLKNRKDIPFFDEDIDESEIEDYLHQFEYLSTKEIKQPLIRKQLSRHRFISLNKDHINPLNNDKDQRIYYLDKNGNLQTVDLTNSNAIYGYAHILEYGKGIEQNYSEAIKYYKMAIDLGNSSAMFCYASMLEYGKGIEQNYSEAIKYYKMAIDLGNSNAMYFYAVMLRSGKGIERNYSEAIKYYKMAIDLGNSNAMLSYALMFKTGKVIERNYSEAIKYYKMAVDKGNSRALAKYNTILDSLPKND